MGPVEGRLIRDSSITASSTRGRRRNMSKARIGDNGGWCPSKSDASPYLQFDLEKLYLICGFQVIKGGSTAMSSYRVHVSPEKDYLNSWNIVEVMTWACLLLLQIK